MILTRTRATVSLHSTSGSSGKCKNRYTKAEALRTRISFLVTTDSVHVKPRNPNGVFRVLYQNPLAFLERETKVPSHMN